MLRIGFVGKIVGLPLLMILLHQEVCLAFLQPARIFSDNMVLQRNIEIPIWGNATPKEKVTILFNGIRKSTITNAVGNWEIYLPPQKAGGSYNLKLISKKDSITFTNVLIGDVWFASGQSNMEHPLKGWDWIPHSEVNNYEEELKDANYSQIRLFNVQKFPSPFEQDDLFLGSWETSNPETVAHFSSIAWFFAKELHQKLDIPIGIIHSSWGGTNIQSWMSRESLLKFKDSIKISPVPENFIAKDWKHTLKESWLDYIEHRKQISFPPSHLPKIVEMNCKKFSQDKKNLSEQLEFNTHVVWFRKEVNLPTVRAHHELTLSLGFLNRQSHIFINGEEVGYFLYPNPVKITLPSHLLKKGKNILAIRLANPAKKLQVFGNEDDFRLFLSNDSFSINISQGWLINNQLESVGLPVKTFQNNAGYLFNGMISPIIPFAIKGFIWYQGESNISRPFIYEKLFIELIANWRKRWGQVNLPFLFVQLSNLERTHEFHKPDYSMSHLRESQQKALELSHTGMVVSIDIGDSLDIHPKNKQDYGHRLVLQALKVAYHFPITAEGPTIKNYHFKDDTVFMEFDDELFIYEKRSKNLEVAGKDEIFHKTHFKLDGNKVIFISPVKNPKAVRYAWQNNPETIIKNKEGISAAPFLLEIQ